MIGANVVVKGTTNGTITDLDGKFSLDGPPNATLVISYVGFIDQEITVVNSQMLSWIYTYLLEIFLNSLYCMVSHFKESVVVKKYLT